MGDTDAEERAKRREERRKKRQQQDNTENGPADDVDAARKERRERRARERGETTEEQPEEQPTVNGTAEEDDSAQKEEEERQQREEEERQQREEKERQEAEERQRQAEEEAARKREAAEQAERERQAAAAAAEKETERKKQEQKQKAAEEERKRKEAEAKKAADSKKSDEPKSDSGKKKGKGILSKLSINRKKKGGLKALLMDKAKDSLKKEAAAKEQKKQDFISAHVASIDTNGMGDDELANLCASLYDDILKVEGDIFDIELFIRRQDWEIAELQGQANEAKGKFIKPQLKKVEKQTKIQVESSQNDQMRSGILSLKHTGPAL
ncbi:uncharacterized protein [Antedon mediterranea]|uniref:uncharacterized protein isoform X6 n=1 Tax=Antedon mediterranea TaxID=105859 RepID=UPI003AF8CF05